MVTIRRDQPDAVNAREMKGMKEMRGQQVHNSVDLIIKRFRFRLRIENCGPDFSVLRMR